MLSGMLCGAYVGVGIVSTWVLADILMIAMGARYSLSQIIAKAWYSRPRRALSRERRTWTQGPGG